MLLKKQWFSIIIFFLLVISKTANAFSDSELVQIALSAANQSCGMNYGNKVRSVAHAPFTGVLVVRLDTYCSTILAPGYDGVVQVNSEGTITYQNTNCPSTACSVDTLNILSVDSIKKLALLDTFHQSGSFQCQIDAQTGEFHQHSCAIMCEVPPCCHDYSGLGLLSIVSDPRLVLDGRLYYQFYMEESQANNSVSYQNQYRTNDNISYNIRVKNGGYLIITASDQKQSNNMRIDIYSLNGKSVFTKKISELPFRVRLNGLSDFVVVAKLVSHDNKCMVRKLLTIR